MDNFKAKYNYQLQINEGLKNQIQNKDLELAEEKQFSKLLIFFNVVTIVVGIFLVGSVIMHG
ncbi:hypothetical protein [Ornithinibacillus xuwenensis]|uniref:Uncharacterized protein n=1 Tax=Ornithinibacillus xuwenensis TaxID=3144668 RepID=A0ABU9XBW9_9BACI